MSDAIAYDVGDGYKLAAELVKHLDNGYARIQTRLLWLPRLQPPSSDLENVIKSLTEQGASNVTVQQHSDPLRKRDFIVTMDIPESWIVGTP